MSAQPELPCGPAPLRDRQADIGFVLAFAIFAFTSFVMEWYPVLGVNLRTATDPLGRAWYLYAGSWDPIFLHAPVHIRVMCAVDAFVFGPFYLVAIYALVRARDWIRLPGLCYAAVIVYSTLVYFAEEFLGQRGHAHLTMVVMVNLPYLIIPLLFARRMWAERPFRRVA